MPDLRIVAALDRLIVGANALTAVEFEEAGLDSSVTLQQWRVLVVVGDGEGGKRIGAIAAHLRTSLPSASRLVRRLERRGLVETARDESDRRATVVRLTETGRNLRATIFDGRRRLIGSMLDELGQPLPRDLTRGLEALADGFARFS